MTCRICTAPTREVLDLGESPPANWLKASPDDEQDSFPLVLEWCQTCDNVQLRDTVSAESLYTDYLYVTPDSPTLDAHYDSMLSYLVRNEIVRPDSFVVEPGSNAGRFLARIRGDVGRVLGVDPAARIAEIAREAGIPTLSDFFNEGSAEAILREHGKADLIVARHCLAHNPSPHEMLRAASVLLTDDGHLVIENAYVLDTLENGEFDQIYHEHMFYFSVTSMRALLAMHHFHLVDVVLSEVHGGSIVFIAARGETGPSSKTVERQQSRERDFLSVEAFASFARSARDIRDELRRTVLDLHASGSSIFAYGATAKGTTLLNFAGLTSEQISFCVDSTQLKQGRFLPKSNIEVISEASGAARPPDYFLLTAWNYRDEIIAKVRKSGNGASRFIVPIPSVQIV